MHKLNIEFRDGHLFVELDGRLWLFDTGAPASFGELHNLTLVGNHYSLDDNYMGLTAKKLREFTGVQCAGLLGADILGNFDHIIDCNKGIIKIATDEIEYNGRALNLSSFMGIPILTACIAGHEYRLFFDTGAQISYFQDGSLQDFPPSGKVTDFYPGFGQFETYTYQVDISLDDVDFTLRCGALPSLLGATLMMANTQGIIGNQILSYQVIGYFPRRNLLCL